MPPFFVRCVISLQRRKSQVLSYTHHNRLAVTSSSFLSPLLRRFYTKLRQLRRISCCCTLYLVQKVENGPDEAWYESHGVPPPCAHGNVFGQNALHVNININSLCLLLPLLLGLEGSAEGKGGVHDCESTEFIESKSSMSWRVTYQVSSCSILFHLVRYVRDVCM